MELLNNYLFVFEQFSMSNLIDIGIIAIVFYIIYMKVSKTRIMPILQSFMVILLLTFLSSIFGLTTTHYILQNVVSLMFLAAIILFPAEIKRGLNQIGDAFFRKYMFNKMDDTVINNVVKAMGMMSRSKVGAIIIIEGKDGLTEIIENGTSLNAQVEGKLLLTIFDKRSLLHDGAVVISRNKIRAAGCFIPQLSSTINKQNTYGSRHLAAIGLSETTDAYILIISEQTGKISVAHRGELTSGIGQVKLKRLIENFFSEIQKGFLLEENVKS